MLRKLLFIISFTVVFFQSCGKNYDDIHTGEGRRAILDKANSYLTGNMCNEAQEVLKPLYNSIYVDDEIRMTYASTYACQGGLNFAMIIGALLSGASDIWASLVLANFNSNSNSGKPDALREAARILRTTSRNPNSYNAVDRPEDANTYMIFIQLEVITTTIGMSAMGNANPITGKKNVSISGTGSAKNICDIQVAISTIADSISHVSTTGAMATLNTKLNTICGGGGCVTNLDPGICTAGTQVSGAAFIVGIDNMWGF